MMTYAEAIKDIKQNIKPVVGGVSLDLAVEALELQIPMKVKRILGDCPKCGSWFGGMPNYCPECGQAIDWRDFT